MVFQKRAKKCSEQTFYIGNQAIDVVQDYTYLGTKISSSGNFKISLDHQSEIKRERTSCPFQSETTHKF